MLVVAATCAREAVENLRVRARRCIGIAYRLLLGQFALGQNIRGGNSRTRLGMAEGAARRFRSRPSRSNQERSTRDCDERAKKFLSCHQLTSSSSTPVCS